MNDLSTFSTDTQCIKIPKRIAALKKDERGFPVYWNLHIDWNDVKVPISQQAAEQIMGKGRFEEAVRVGLCWYCGDPLGRHKAFAAGPLATANRLAKYPPGHRDCAIYFASLYPHTVEGKAKQDIILIWITNQYYVRDKGSLLHMGEPLELIWMQAGRTPSRRDILKVLAPGFDQLRKLAEQDGAIASKRNDCAIADAMGLLPDD